MAEEKNVALENLKKLVYKGYMTTVVDMDGIKVTLKTLSMQEEYSVMEESGIDNAPRSAKDLLRYIPAVLKYSIIAIDGAPVTKEQVGEIIGNSNSSQIITQLYGAYLDMDSKRLQAGAKIKNSSATPTPSFIG